MSMIAQALAEFDEPKAAIAIVKSYGTLTLAADGIGKIEEAHKQVKRLRIDIDKRRKDLTAGALTYQRAINEEAKRLTAEVEPIEKSLWSQRQIHEAEKEKERQAKEAEKQAVLQSRIEKLAQAGCVASDVVALQKMDDDEFALHLMRESAKAQELREAAESARIEAEKREADRLAEVERQAEELRIRREEIEAERKAMEAEREAMLHQQAIERRHIEEQQAEVRRQKEEIRMEAERKAEAERQRLLAERKAEDERLAQIAAEEAEAYRLRKIEELKPEIEKASDFMKAAVYWADKKLTEIGRPYWSEFALKKIEEACIEIGRHIERG